MTWVHSLLAAIVCAVSLQFQFPAFAQVAPVPAELPPVAAKQPEPPVSYPLLSEADAASEKRIQEALAKPITADWKGVAMKDVIAQLADDCDITIVLTKRIEDAGVTVDQPITRKLVKSSLRSTLRLILQDLNLNYMIKDEVIKITTFDGHIAESMAIRVYPVNDLVDAAKAKDAKPTLDFNPLISLIEQIEPDSWQDVGGPGCVKGFDNAGCLFISQRDDVHERIDTLLITLRRVKAVQGLKAPPITVPNRYLPPTK